MHSYKQMLEKPKGESKNRQSRDTGNIEHTRHKLKTNKPKQHSTTQHNITWGELRWSQKVRKQTQTHKEIITLQQTTRGKNELNIVSMR